LLIRPGEGRLLIYLAGLNLLLGLGMALGRSSSDALFFKRFGVEYLPHMLFLTSLVLVGVSAAYATIVDRLRPGRLFNLLFLFFCLYLLAVWSAMRMADGVTAFALYYVGYGVISEILVVHFGFYALGHFDSLQAKRLFPMVSAAARLGAVVGGVAMGVASSLLPPEDVALGWIATMVVAIVLIKRQHRNEPATAKTSGSRRKSPWNDIREGLRFARGSSLLRISALGMFIMILVISIQDYLASTLLTRHFSDERSLAAFFGWFFALTNGVVLLLQLFATNRMLRRFGLQTVNLIFPATSVISLALLTLSAGFWSAVVTRFNYMGLLPAFRIPAASLFYNALPTYMQGRARALEMGLVLPAGFAFAGLLLMLIPPEAVDERLAAFGLVLAVFYLWLKTRKNHHYGNALLDVLKQQVFSGRPAELGQGLLTAQVIEGMQKLARESQDDECILAIAELLAEQAPAQAGPFLIEIAADTTPRTQDHLLQLIGRLRPKGWEDYARTCLTHPDHHLRATALGLLAQAQTPNIEAIIQGWLTSDSLRLQAAATRLAIASDDAHLVSAGKAALDAMLVSPAIVRQRAAICVIEQSRSLDRLPRLREFIDTAEESVRLAAVRALGVLAREAGLDIDPTLSGLMQDPSAMVRVAVLTALPAARDPGLRLSLLAQALDDPDYRVRAAASAPTPDLMPPDEAGWRTALHHYFNNFAMQSLICHALARSELPAWRTLLVETAARHADSAREKHELQQALPSVRDPSVQDSDFMFLSTVLAEEVQRHVTQILGVMVLLDESEASRVIQAGLASRDRCLRAQALESVRHLEHAAIFHRLLPLMEGEHNPEMTQAIQNWAERSWNEILAWCEQEGSQWLAQCAATLAFPAPRRS
jgi:hypothetical protein